MEVPRGLHFPESTFLILLVIIIVIWFPDGFGSRPRFREGRSRITIEIRITIRNRGASTFAPPPQNYPAPRDLPLTVSLSKPILPVSKARCFHGIEPTERPCNISDGRKKMKTKWAVVIAVLSGTLLLAACRQSSSPPPNPAQKQAAVSSPEQALQIATNYLDKKDIDLSLFDTLKPEDIRKFVNHDKAAWRVTWRPKDKTGIVDDLVVIVRETGECEQGWEE